MRKQSLVSLALLGTLAIAAGCGNSTTSTPNPDTTPVPDAQSSATTAPATSQPAATTAITAADIEAKLTAAGFKFTTKDKTAAATGLAHGASVSKSTEFKVTVPNDTVILTVVELKDPAQKIAVTSDVQMQFIAAQDAGYKAVLGDMGSDSVVVGVIYKEAVEKDAWKVEDAIGAK